MLKVCAYIFFLATFYCIIWSHCQVGKFVTRDVYQNTICLHSFGRFGHLDYFEM